MRVNNFEIEYVEGYYTYKEERVTKEGKTYFTPLQTYAKMEDFLKVLVGLGEDFSEVESACYKARDEYKLEKGIKYGKQLLKTKEYNLKKKRSNI
jgi:hypothetical protein